MVIFFDFSSVGGGGEAASTNNLIIPRVLYRIMFPNRFFEHLYL